MAGSPAPATTRRRPWFVRAARQFGALVVLAVFGFGLLASAALVAVAVLLYFGLGLTTAGLGLGIAGLVVGLVYAVAQGTPV